MGFLIILLACMCINGLSLDTLIAALFIYLVFITVVHIVDDYYE